MARHYSPTRKDAYRVNRAADRVRDTERRLERAHKRAQHATTTTREN